MCAFIGYNGILAPYLVVSPPSQPHTGFYSKIILTVELPTANWRNSAWQPSFDLHAHQSMKLCISVVVGGASYHSDQEGSLPFIFLQNYVRNFLLLLLFGLMFYIVWSELVTHEGILLVLWPRNDCIVSNIIKKS